MNTTGVPVRVLWCSCWGCMPTMQSRDERFIQILSLWLVSQSQAYSLIGWKLNLLCCHNWHWLMVFPRIFEQDVKTIDHRLIKCNCFKDQNHSFKIQPVSQDSKPRSDTLFRNPYFYFRHAESTSTASQLISPASQKSKDLNKVPLLLQDLACDTLLCQSHGLWLVRCHQYSALLGWNWHANVVSNMTIPCPEQLTMISCSFSVSCLVSCHEIGPVQDLSKATPRPLTVTISKILIGDILFCLQCLHYTGCPTNP